jgi:hypothetical protein
VVSTRRTFLGFSLVAFVGLLPSLVHATSPQLKVRPPDGTLSMAVATTASGELEITTGDGDQVVEDQPITIILPGTSPDGATVVFEIQNVPNLRIRSRRSGSRRWIRWRRGSRRLSTGSYEMSLVSGDATAKFPLVVARDKPARAQ